MHELAVTESILEIALRHAAGAERITALHLVIGQLSSIVDDSVQFYWDVVAKGTPAEGAQLHFQRVPAEFACQDCEQRYPINDKEFACPACGSFNTRIISGDEFRLEAIEVEREKHYEPTD
jgi:hydrogenase nickel incorporation protein HypA/HybF